MNDNRDIVELAAWISANSRLIVQSGVAVSEEALHSYWSASRRRSANWIRWLKGYPAAQERVSAEEGAALWQRTRALIAEIIAAEILARVWGAVLAAADAAQDGRQAEPLARAVLGAHVEAHHRALCVLVYAPRVPLDDASELSRLSQHAERWSDLLIAPLIGYVAARPFAADAERATDFAHLFSAASARRAVGRLIRVSLRHVWRRLRLGAAPSEAENRQIALSMLESLPQEAFDRWVPASVARLRAENNGCAARFEVDPSEDRP